MSLEELLKQGKVTEFNKQRPVRGKLDLFAADLAGADLRGADLSKANLEKADLSGANLSGVNLAGANLSGADLSDADLTEAMALKSKWREAYVENANFTGIELAQSDLTGAEFENCDFSTANFSSARVKHAVFVGCTFRDAELAEARFSDAQLQKADLSGVNAPQAHFSRADLTGAMFIGAELSNSKFAGATLNGADLSMAKMRNANMTGADFTDAVLEQTDLTRADLTEAVTETDFSTAILAEAQLDGALGESAQAAIPDAARLFVEDPTVAVSGKHVSVLWENPEPGGARLRLAVSPLGGPPATPPQAIPVPLDLILAKSICATSTGFAVALLVERPSGVSLMLSHWGTDGQRASQRTVRLGYTPLVRPILREEGSDLLLYGISREGPALLVQKITDEGLEPINGERMTTVRGFVSELDPVVLTKGGVVRVMRSKGKGQPMRAPESFPGRSSASASTGRDLAAMVWAERSRRGLHVAHIAPNETPDEQRLLPKQLIGTVTAGALNGTAWAGFTIEAPTPDVPASAWAVALDGSKPIPVLQDADQDVDLVRMAHSNSGLYMAVTTLDGTMLLYTLSTRGAKKVGSLG